MTDDRRTVIDANNDLAQRAIEEEAAALAALAECQPLADEAADVGRMSSRSKRHPRLQALIDRAGTSEHAERARRHWDEAAAHCWELARREARPLVSHEVRRRYVSGRAVTERDLEQHAMIGMFKAACRYEPERGLKFSTYARWWVRAELNRVAQHGLSAVRIPDSSLKVLWKLSSDKPTDVRPERAEEVRALTRSASLDAPVSDDSELTFKDALEGGPNPHEVAVKHESRRRLRRSLRRVPKRQRFILERYYGLQTRGGGASFREIGEDLSLSAERVRQLHHKAVRHIERGLEH